MDIALFVSYLQLSPRSDPPRPTGGERRVTIAASGPHLPRSVLLSSMQGPLDYLRLISQPPMLARFLMSAILYVIAHKSGNTHANLPDAAGHCFGVELLYYGA